MDIIKLYRFDCQNICMITFVHTRETYVEMPTGPVFTHLQQYHGPRGLEIMISTFLHSLVIGRHHLHEIVNSNKISHRLAILHQQLCYLGRILSDIHEMLIHCNNRRCNNRIMNLCTPYFT